MDQASFRNLNHMALLTSLSEHNSNILFHEYYQLDKPMSARDDTGFITVLRLLLDMHLKYS